jgi:hypothetical protein
MKRCPIEDEESRLRADSCGSKCVFSRYAYKDGRLYSGPEFSTLREALVDDSPCERRMNSRAVFDVDGSLYNRRDEEESLVMVDPRVVKKLRGYL